MLLVILLKKTKFSELIIIKLKNLRNKYKKYIFFLTYAKFMLRFVSYASLTMPVPMD